MVLKMETLTTLSVKMSTNYTVFQNIK